RLPRAFGVAVAVERDLGDDQVHLLEVAGRVGEAHGDMAQPRAGLSVGRAARQQIDAGSDHQAQGKKLLLHGGLSIVVEASMRTASLPGLKRGTSMIDNPWGRTASTKAHRAGVISPNFGSFRGICRFLVRCLPTGDTAAHAFDSIRIT